MKPYVVIIKQMKDNKIILTEDELKSIIERAYRDGYNDGYNSGSSHNWWNYPSITYCGNNIDTNSTGTPMKPYEGITITCNNDGDKIKL